MLVEQISTTFLQLSETLDSQASEMLQVFKCTIYVYLQKLTQYISGKKAGRAERQCV